MTPGLGAAVALLIEAKARANRRARYLKGLESYLLRLARELGPEMPIHQVRPDQLSDFLFRSHPAASTVASNGGRMASLFSFAVRRGWLRSSPMAALDRITIEPATPRIYRARQVAALMGEAARKRPTRRVVPALSLGFFCGIRPEEITHLRWDDIRESATGGVVVVAHTKARDRRLVPLSRNAAEWLDWSHRHDGELPPPSNTKRTLRRIRAKLALPSIQDGARHTAATMMHARGDEPHRIARALGNSTRILFSHYVDALAVGPEEAAEFWNILPPSAQRQMLLEFVAGD